MQSIRSLHRISCPDAAKNGSALTGRQHPRVSGNQGGKLVMPLLTALAISIGVLGGVATWAFVGPAAALSLQIWAAFVAWAAFYHSGGTSAALRSNIPAHILGAFVGWLALVGTTSLAGSL